MVSIIIPTTLKEAMSAHECAESIRRSTYKNVEIFIICENKERSIQRNIGIGKAKGQYLLFIDSDQRVQHDMIADCVNRIKYFGGIYIPEIVMGDDWFAKLRNWERQFYISTPVDVCRFVRAYQCPKFSEELSGPEDSDWDRRIQGGKTISKSCVYHYENVSLWQWLRKKSYYARSMDRFAMHNPGDKVLDWKWRCWGVFTENGKWKRFFTKPHYALAVLTLILIRGIIYLCVAKSS